MKESAAVTGSFFAVTPSSADSVAASLSSSDSSLESLAIPKKEFFSLDFLLFSVAAFGFFGSDTLFIELAALLAAAGSSDKLRDSATDEETESVFPFF